MISLPQAKAKALRDNFLVGLLEAALRTEPDRVEWLMMLGEAYTARGDYARGLEVDLKLSRLTPRDAVVWYNLACSYSLTGGTTESLTALERAVRLGYRDGDFMERDRDLRAVRQDPRFAAVRDLVLRLQEEEGDPEGGDGGEGADGEEGEGEGGPAPGGEEENEGG